MKFPKKKQNNQRTSQKLLSKQRQQSQQKVAIRKAKEEINSKMIRNIKRKLRKLRRLL